MHGSSSTRQFTLGLVFTVTTLGGWRVAHALDCTDVDPEVWVLELDVANPADVAVAWGDEFLLRPTQDGTIRLDNDSFLAEEYIFAIFED